MKYKNKCAMVAAMARKPRDVSPEERREWREETARDARFHEDDAPDMGNDAPAPTLTPVAPKKRPVRVWEEAPPAPMPKARYLAVGDLSRLDGKSAKKFTKETKTRDGVIDLHDMNQDEAYRAITRFIAKAEREGWRNLRIITGKGARSGGILREKTLDWLNSAPFATKVLAISHAAPREGGEGVLLVLLKRKR